MITSQNLTGRKTSTVTYPQFENSAAPRALKRSVRSPLLQALNLHAPLRVWVPQCTGGEHVHSVAIALIEAMGAHWREISLRVYSSGMSAERIHHARAGRYPLSAVQGAPERIRRFFVQTGGQWQVRRFVRDACRFMTDEAARPLPFSGLDVIVCSERLAELSVAERHEAFRTFHRALGPGGLLFDPTCTVDEFSDLFGPLESPGSYSVRSETAKTDSLGFRSRDSDEHLKLLFNNSEEALLVRDAETDLIVDANEAARRLFGLSLREFRGTQGKDLVASETAYRRLSNERRSKDRLAMPHYVRRDGTVFPASASAVPFVRKGRPAELWIVRDLTERLRLKSGSQREDEHNAFLGEVVHELRTPMTVIRGSAETLRLGIRSPRIRSKFLKAIENQTVNMARMVDGLLELNATRSVKRDTQAMALPLAQAVWAIVPSFVARAKRRGISLRVDIAESLSVLVDSNDLRHILGNLLDNAIKYNHPGGRVQVRGAVEGGRGVLSVKDTGSGIPPDDLEKVFERFYRCERTQAVKGNGLGLAIVRAMVKANHGRIVAENNAEGGSVFHVSFPLAS
ncbi:MAG: PAS domain S-box protein [Elusimicrobia bacterium]|nr:PAS domain S-box protein [Elusimicrobiota bacterium]